MNHGVIGRTGIIQKFDNMHESVEPLIGQVATVIDGGFTSHGYKLLLELNDGSLESFPIDAVRLIDDE